MILINNTTARITRFTCSVLLLGIVATIRSFHTGGRAHNVAVLSALVLRNENSVGCQRPEITLSWCCATTTLGRGIVRSPEEEESVQSTVRDIRQPQWWITTLCEYNELWKPKHHHLCKSSRHQACINYDSILLYHQQKAICSSVVIPWQKAALFLHHRTYKNKKNNRDLLTLNVAARASTVSFCLQTDVPDKALMQLVILPFLA